MVDVNFGRARPEAILDLTRVRALAEWEERDGALRIGAGVSYTRRSPTSGTGCPAWRPRRARSARRRSATAARSAATSAPPPPPATRSRRCTRARLTSSSPRRAARAASRSTDFITGPKRNVLEPDELIAAVHVPPARGAQQFSKVGTRNAMVIAVCSFALALDPEQRRGPHLHRLGRADAGPRDRRRDVRGGDELGLGRRAPRSTSRVATRFGELVAQAASPIDDVRGSAAYRRHALSVLARRTLTWAWSEQCA